MRTLQTEVVRRQNRRRSLGTARSLRASVVEDRLRFPLAQIEHFTRASRIGPFKTVRGKLLLLRKPYFSIAGMIGPSQLEHAIHVLQKRRDSFQSVRQLARYGIKIQSPGLLKVRELCDFQPIQ